MSARPKTVRGRRTRERILAAAARLIHVNGVAATSVDDVLAASRTGKGQFYHYFRSKDDLVDAVARHQIARILAREMPVLERLDDWAAIGEWFRLTVEGHEERGLVGGCPIGSLAAELADRDERLRELLARAFEAKREFLVRGLTAMKERGALQPDADPEALGRFVIAAMQGGLLLATTHRDVAYLQDALNAALAHLETWAL